MNCKYCGTVNSEEAIYCKMCGKRLDGKQICKSCGAENDEDALYCIKCGTPFAQTSRKVSKNGATNREVVADNQLWKKVLEIIGWSFAMLGLFFTLLFTFLIGMGVKAGLGNADFSNILGDLGHNIYYFFSGGYKEIHEAMQNAALTDAQLVTMYLPVVMGTVVAVGVISAVCALTALSICKFVAYLKGNRSKDFAKTTIFAYAVYIVGSLALLSLYHVSVLLNYSGLTVSASVALNSSTVAGISVAGVCLFVFAVFRVAVRGKKIVQNRNLLHLILSSVGVTILSVMISFVPCAALGISEGDGSYTSAMTMSFLQMLEAYILPNVSEIGKELVVAIVAQVVQIALIATVACAMVYQLCSVCEDKRYKQLPWSISICALASLYLALSIVYAVLIEQVSGYDKMTMISPIVIMVFAVLYLALSIVQTVFKAKEQPIAQPAIE